MKNILFSFTLLFSVLFTVAQTTKTGPRAVFGNLEHDGPYDRSEILLQEKLTVSSDDNQVYTITAYHLTIAPTTGKSIRFEVEGEKLPAKLQGVLNQVVAGDKIHIESIRATTDGTDALALKSIVLEVKTYTSDGPYDAVWPNFNEPIKTDSFLIATFGDLHPSKPHSKEDILKQAEIGTFSKIGLDYNVISFKMIVAFKKAPATMASTSSNKLTPKMKEILSRSTSGDRILIEGIRAQTTINGEVIKANLSPIIITVL